MQGCHRHLKHYSSSALLWEVAVEQRLLFGLGHNSLWQEQEAVLAELYLCSGSLSD